MGAYRRERKCQCQWGMFRREEKRVGVVAWGFASIVLVFLSLLYAPTPTRQYVSSAMLSCPRGGSPLALTLPKFSLANPLVASYLASPNCYVLEASATTC